MWTGIKGVGALPLVVISAETAVNCMYRLDTFLELCKNVNRGMFFQRVYVKLQYKSNCNVSSGVSDVR